MAFFKWFSGGWREPQHIRRTRAYLKEAQMAMLEHSIAAENYRASANMYQERVQRLEAEIAAWQSAKSGVVPAPDTSTALVLHAAEGGKSSHPPTVVRVAA